MESQGGGGGSAQGKANANKQKGGWVGGGCRALQRDAPSKKGKSGNLFRDFEGLGCVG